MFNKRLIRVDEEKTLREHIAYFRNLSNWRVRMFENYELVKTNGILSSTPVIFFSNA